MDDTQRADGLREAIDLVDAFLAAFEPPRWSSADAATLVEMMVRLERLAATCRTMAAGRVVDGNGWQGDGHRSALDWLAARTGTGRAEAAGTLETAAAVPSCPRTEEALRQGRLSPVQAGLIAAAVLADPTAEAALVAEAATAPMESLRRSCRQVRAAATADEQLAGRNDVHRSRYLRTWTDDAGACNGRFRITADAGAVVTAVLDGVREGLFRAARRAGRQERAEALSADALVAMARAATGPCGSGSAAAPEGRGPIATVVVRVDHPALVRGHTVAGEECSVDGTGPVPVATARRFLSDSVVAALLVDGGRIADVRLVGRTVPHRLRLALTARDRCCAVPGCDAARRLEIHHLDPIARAGPTSLDNTCRICSWHHDQITYRGADLCRAGPGWRYRPGADEEGGGPFDDGWTNRAPPGPSP